jgi:hypothetical protein
MRHLKLAFTLIAAPILVTQLVPTALAQTPQRDLVAQRAAMAKLEGLTGRWLGQGERSTPTGEQYRFTQTMDNNPHAGGLLITLQGKSLRQGDADAIKPNPGGSFAVLSYDERTQAYEFRSFGFGEMVPAKAELVTPTTFRWTTAAGPAMLRFTIDMATPGVWKELGERSADGGKTWQFVNRLTAYRVETR